MEQFQKILLLLLRILLGWFVFYAGITKVLTPNWSAAGFLNNASTFPWLYQWFASTTVLPVTDFLNQWGLTLIGLALILGAFVRLSAYSGALLMLLYYFPTLDFPYPTEHTFVIDDHLIYVVALLVLASFHTGRVWGLENWLDKVFSKYPHLQKWLL